MTPDYQANYHLPSDFVPEAQLEPTHHMLPSPARREDRIGIRIATNLSGQPHQLQARWDFAQHRVAVAAWGPFADRFELLAPDALGLTDRSYRDFRPSGAPVADWHHATPAVRLTKAPSILEAIVPIVLSQRILGKEAKQIQRRLFYRCGQAAPGPEGLRAPPSAAALQEIGYETWHLMGLERNRARLVHRCAAEADRLESWRDLDTEELYERLTSIPGIGIWSANRLLYAMGHADAVWVGDYNLPSLVSWNLAGEARADDQRMLELLEPYRGHRARVLRLLELHGSTPPRFGPRLGLRNIQHH